MVHLLYYQIVNYTFLFKFEDHLQRHFMNSTCWGEGSHWHSFLLSFGSCLVSCQLSYGPWSHLAAKEFCGACCSSLLVVGHWFGVEMCTRQKAGQHTAWMHTGRGLGWVKFWRYGTTCEGKLAFRQEAMGLNLPISLQLLEFFFVWLVQEKQALRLFFARQLWEVSNNLD